MKKISLAFVLALFPVLEMAAQGSPPAVPIDGGLTALLAAGGIYGVKKLRDHMKGDN